MNEPTTTLDSSAGLAKLREPFPASAVGKLPRVTCKSCRERNCTEHRPAKCGACGAYTSPAHIHLDYVGHAEVTDRLLSVDPAWTWEPVAFDASGQPVIGREGGELVLWIRLTVCGVTRLGVGTVPAGNADAPKQLVSDALRNAAMRFGVALDLWAKGDLESATAMATAPAPARAHSAPPADDAVRPFDESNMTLAGPLWARQLEVAMTAAGRDRKVIGAVVHHATGGRTRDPRAVLKTEAAQVTATQRRLEAGGLSEVVDDKGVVTLVEGASATPGTAA